MLRKVSFITAAVAALLITSACGLRGSLYLPEDRPDKNRHAAVTAEAENTAAAETADKVSEEGKDAE